MFYDSVDQLLNDLKYYGLVVDQQSKSVRFERILFQSSKPTVNFLNLKLNSKSR